MIYIGAAVSEKGEFRAKNQDRAFAIVPKKAKGHLAVACVCDGIGSYDMSEISASKMTEGLKDWAERIANLYPAKYNENDVADDLSETINELNELIYYYRMESGIDMGCTMSLLLLIDSKYYIYHVGDSRIYRYNSLLQQLTHDEVAVVEKNGTIKNLLANYVGGNNTLWLNRLTGTVNEGDMFIVGSDGLYHKLTQDILMSNLPSKLKTSRLEKMCKNLIKSAYANGEHDNASCAIVIAQNSK